MELVQKTIGGCLKETAAKVGQQTAIEFGDWSCTWSELDEVTDLLAARFMSLYGIQKKAHMSASGARILRRLHRACLLCTRSELL